MSAPPHAARLGPNGRPVRPFVMPRSPGGRLRVWRYLILRRISQAGILLLFLGTAHWGWSVAGRPLLAGNLSASTLLGAVPLADPFAVLQILATGQGLAAPALIGAGVLLLAYALLAGRVFCAWVCPLNPVTDLAAWLRSRLGIDDALRLPRWLRYVVLALALALSALAGVAAFEWVSPIAIAHRELIYGIGLGMTAVLGVFLLDLLVLRHGWCGHLCPLGAFWALWGRIGQLRVRFDAPTCTHCGECARVCPEPQVLNLRAATRRGFVASGECTDCGRCIPVCPEGTLSFDLRPLIARHNRRPRA